MKSAKPARERLSEKELIACRNFCCICEKGGDPKDCTLHQASREALDYRRALRKLEKLVGMCTGFDATETDRLCQALNIIDAALASPLAATKGGR